MIVENIQGAIEIIATTRPAGKAVSGDERGRFMAENQSKIKVTE